MKSFHIPDDKKVRVILDTDVKNEVDDQFAIVHALLSESILLKGIVPAHFGTEKSSHSQKDSYEETMLLLRKMQMQNMIRVENGAQTALTDEATPIDSNGARLIIEEAMREDERPLYLAFLGPLTDMASALLMKPEIAEKNLIVLWIGGREYPTGGWEYNLKNDICAANVVFKSSVPLWQVPRNVYRMMPVSFAELWDKVHPYGEIGAYLAENVVNFNNEWKSRPAEYRILGDSPSVGIILFGDCGEWEWKPAPSFDENMHYVHTGDYRPIKVYKNLNARFILDDFYAKLKLFASHGSRADEFRADNK